MRTLIVFITALTPSLLFGADLEVSKLACEHQTNPSALHAEVPRLSWHLKSTSKGKAQRAYRIIASSSPDALAREEGDLWDTGKQASLENHLIFYKGAEKLISRQRVFWKVRVWDESCCDEGMGIRSSAVARVATTLRRGGST